MSECKFRDKDGECLRERKFPYKEYCADGPCPYYTPQTHADRIRAMTDEELAKHICCPYDQCINLDKPCDECVLDWLKSPVEVDNDD